MRKPYEENSTKFLRMRTSKNGSVIFPKKMIYDKITATNVVFAFDSRRSMYVRSKKLLLLLLVVVVVLVVAGVIVVVVVAAVAVAVIWK